MLNSSIASVKSKLKLVFLFYTYLIITSQEFEILDSGAFDDNRYWDVTTEYAKSSPNGMSKTILKINIIHIALIVILQNY